MTFGAIHRKIGRDMKMCNHERFACGRGIFFLCGMALMGLLQAFLPAFSGSGIEKTGKAEVARAKDPVLCREHKSWGDFEYTKVSLEEPEQLLPDTSQPLAAPRWFFKTDSRRQVEEIFNSV